MPERILRRSVFYGDQGRLIWDRPSGQIFVHSPKDLIIYKTCYFSLSRQTKHLGDISAALTTLGANLDYDYVETWIARHGLLNFWKELWIQYSLTKNYPRRVLADMSGKMRGVALTRRRDPSSPCLLKLWVCPFALVINARVTHLFTLCHPLASID